ncbi:MAG: SatD family protein [Clostridiaceae bacterium]
MYTAIIGDLQNSRQISDREAFQIRFKEILDEINVIYKNDIASNFTITLGDEFQGLLVTPVKTLEIINYIKFRIYPVRSRFGVGVGEITTNINPDESLGADGPAYHRARNMINFIKKNEKSKKTAMGDIRFDVGIGSSAIESVNSTLNLLYFIESRWTPKQRKSIMDSYYYGMTQGEIAEKSGLNQSTVHRSLKASGYFEYFESVYSIEELMKDLYGEK